MPAGAERGLVPLAGPAGAHRLLRLTPPALAAGLAAGALALHAALWGLQAPWGREPLAGTLLLAAGLGWALWAAQVLHRAGTTVQATGRVGVFVDEGPFRLGRNPMVLGMALALLGLAALLGAPALAAAALGFAAVVNQVHIPHEEAQLRRSFGGWYSDYAASVRRWF